MANIEQKNKLMKKSRAKYMSVRFALALKQFNANSPLVKSYINTYYCSHNLVVDEQQNIKTTYCKNRWCFTCNKIRTGQLINAYMPQIESMQDPYFVTLTAPTVAGKYLKSRIKNFEDNWRLITKLYQKTKPFETFNGIRKMECTGRPNDMYHYHYHIIIDGQAQAEWLQNQWLERVKGAKRVAQNIQQVTGGRTAMLEMFKYSTKIITDDPTMFAAKHKTINDFKGLDFIFQSLKGKRIYQPFGKIRKASEDITEQLIVDLQLPDNKTGKFWKWFEKDWINEFGELLADYEPTENIQKLLKYCPPSQTKI